MRDLVRGKIHDLYALDYRSLALLRIGVAVAIITDLICRGADLFVHYTDAGVLPRFVVLEHWTNQSFFSLHFLNGGVWFQGFLFCIAFVFAIMLLLGYRTRLVTVVSWILLTSLHARNPLVLQGGDVVLRVILFWMMFLPLSQRFSLDRFLNRIAPSPKSTISSPATFAYIIQICLVFFFSGILKTGLSWQNGSAAYLALSLDQFVTMFGVYMKRFPELLKWGTQSVRYVEIYGPLLLFIPFRPALFRMIAIVLFVGLQIVFNTTLHLGLFGMIMTVVLFGCFPSEFWEWIKKVMVGIRRNERPSLKIYYDADCTFCAKATSLIRRFFLHPDTFISPANIDPDIERVMIKNNSWVIMDKQGSMYFEWDGVVRVAEESTYLSWTVPFLRIGYVQKVGIKAYRFVANRRKNVCAPGQFPRSQKISRKGDRIKKGIIIFLVVYIVLWNIDGVIPQNMKWIGYVTRLDQKFNFFAPEPLTEDGWYVIPGMLRDNTTVDVYTGESLTYLKPDSVLYKNQRWQKYMMNLWNKDNKKFRLYYGKYLCRAWNSTRPKEKDLMKYTIVFMLEKTPKEGESARPVKPTTIWEHSCF